MIPKKYRGQVIVDVAALLVLALIFVIHYGITVPYEKTILKNIKN